MIHAEHTVTTLRYYASGSYEEKSPYSLVLTVVHEDDNIAIVKGMKGDLDKKALLSIQDWLKSQGYSQYREQRKGKWRTKTL